MTTPTPSATRHHAFALERAEVALPIVADKEEVRMIAALIEKTGNAGTAPAI